MNNRCKNYHGLSNSYYWRGKWINCDVKVSSYNKCGDEKSTRGTTNPFRGTGVQLSETFRMFFRRRRRGIQHTGATARKNRVIRLGRKLIKRTDQLSDITKAARENKDLYERVQRDFDNANREEAEDNFETNKQKGDKAEHQRNLNECKQNGGYTVTQQRRETLSKIVIIRTI